MDIAFSAVSPTDLDADLLVVGVSGDLAPALTDALGDAGAKLAAFLEARDFKPTAGAAFTLPAFDTAKAIQIAVVGLGDGDLPGFAKAAGKVGSLARDAKTTSVGVAFGSLSAERVRDLVEYVHVGNYFYETYLPEDKRKPAIATLTLLGTEEAPQAVAQATVRAKYQRLARDLVNAPAADIYPDTLAAEARGFASIDHVEVDIWDLAKCKAEGLVGIIAVGQGSNRPGNLIHLTYRPPGASEHVALVGKGVTFDAGGLSLKPSSAMQTMRCDMGGGATTLAAFGAIAELGLPIAVDAFVPAVENMTGGAAFKLGDILTYRNGVSVEIHNTDAEGRLILADALCLASEVDGVSRIVDMATLTGAIIVGLGPDYTGLFTADDGLASELQQASDAAAEQVWRLPLDTAYNRMLKGTWGQIKNVGGREGGSITAALFLHHFVRDDVRWAHLDIAGTAFIDKPVEPFVAGGSGQVVRTLVNWAASLAD